MEVNKYLKNQIIEILELLNFKRTYNNLSFKLHLQKHFIMVDIFQVNKDTYNFYICNSTNFKPKFFFTHKDLEEELCRCITINEPLQVI